MKQHFLGWFCRWLNARGILTHPSPLGGKPCETVVEYVDAWRITPRRLVIWRVRAEECSTCIFKPQSPVTRGLRQGRLRQLITDTRRHNSYIVCHSTFNDQPAACRGFVDRYSTNMIRIIQRLGGWTEIKPPSMEKP